MPIKQTFVLALIARAACLHAATLAQLIPQSDAIILGSQSSVAVVGTLAILNISVERVFTGNVGVGSVIAVTWSMQHVAFPVASGSYSQRGIWFLQRAADGSWACIPASSYGNKKLTLADLPLPASTGALPPALAYDPSNTALLDQLVLEVAATQPSDPNVVINSLGGSSSASVTQALHYIAGNRTGDLGLMGLAWLIGQGDVPSLLQAEQMASKLEMTSYGAQYLVGTIGAAFRNPDPRRLSEITIFDHFDHKMWWSRGALIAIDGCGNSISDRLLAVLPRSAVWPLRQTLPQNYNWRPRRRSRPFTQRRRCATSACLRRARPRSCNSRLRRGSASS